MAFVSVKRFNKIYPNGHRAVRDFSLDIDKGEFIVLVGPSGCGKSTILRMIAGLEEISSGELYLEGEISNEVHAKNRDIAMVFQNYALYPHLTVYENMAFSLNLANQDKAEIKERVLEVAELLGLSELLTRKPGQLSGGQKQRVALGRALVRRPRLFLLDEPLSNLDAKIRADMRSEIKKLHERVQGTFIYVTHDQIEATTMADRIVILNFGVCQQIGSPLEIYLQPKNLFAATFLGTPQMNIFKGQLVKEGNDLFVVANDLKIQLPEYAIDTLIDQNKVNIPVSVGIRPDDTVLFDKRSNVKGHLEILENLGEKKEAYYSTNLASNLFIVTTKEKAEDINANKDADIYIKPELIHVFDERGERVLGFTGKSILRNVVFSSDSTNAKVVFDGQEVKFSYPENVIEPADNKEIYLTLEQDAISLEEKENALRLQGVVKHTQDIATYKVVYVKLPDGQNISFKTTLDAQYKQNDKVTLFVDVDKAELFDTENNKLVANYVLMKNEISLKGVHYEIPLNPKDNVSLKKHKGFTKFVVMDDEDLGNSSLVYAKAPEGELVNIISEQKLDRHDSPYIYICLSK